MSRILVIDDEEDYRLILKDVLGEAGHDVRVCSDGQEALELLSDCSPELLIVDWVMPQVDGLELVRRIRADSGHAGLPIILLSIKRTEEDELEALHAGADEFMSKPFASEDLLARIGALLRRCATR